MEYNVDEKKHKIELTGSKREIKKFARCLVEIINKHYVSEFDSTKITSEPVQHNPSSYERIYLSNTSLIYIPNVHDEEARKFHFNILMIHYQKAREKFEKH